MKKVATFLISSIALFGSHIANAETYTPTGTWVFEGSVDVYKGINLTCDAVVTVNNPVGTSGSATATVALSGGFLGLCSTIGFPGPPTSPSAKPYPVTYAPAVGSALPKVTLNGVYVDTITAGDCYGGLTADWDDANNALIIGSDIVEAVSGADCVISNGYLDLVSPGNVTITP